MIHQHLPHEQEQSPGLQGTEDPVFIEDEKNRLSYLESKRAAQRDVSSEIVQGKKIKFHPLNIEVFNHDVLIVHSNLLKGEQMISHPALRMMETQMFHTNPTSVMKYFF